MDNPKETVRRLAPCPFCGNDGSGSIEDALHIIESEHDFRGVSWTVQCDKCTATMGYSDSEEEAVEAWNRRAIQSGIDADRAAREAGLVEALRRIAKEYPFTGAGSVANAALSAHALASATQSNLDAEPETQKTAASFGDGWCFDMDEAPRDGTEIIIQVKSRAGISGGFLIGHWMNGGHCIEDHPPISQGWYFWNGCMFDRASEPTAWRHLPTPPSPAKREEG